LALYTIFAMGLVLYDAERCPYCARVRIVLAEKGLPYETVAIDLARRPAWLYEKNPVGKVPVLEDDALCLAESAVIMEYLNERYPKPPLLPGDPAERALARLAIWRFEEELGQAYYARRRGQPGSEEALARSLADLDARLAQRPYLGGSAYSLADIAWFPWLPRAQRSFAVDLAPYPHLSAWLERLSQRPALAAETALVAASAP
jgi:RNA polymerase-associated protein